MENKPVEAGRARRAADWTWSSARAHVSGVDTDDLLCFDQWRHLFGKPENIATDWMIYLEGPREAVRQNAARLRSLLTGSRHNRPVHWVTDPPSCP